MSDLPPPKPWEINRSSSSANIYGPLHSGTSNTVNDSRPTAIPPPVPARPSQRVNTPPNYQSNYGSFGSYPSYGGGYSGGYSGMYGGGMYGGMYGNSMNGYNRPYSNTGGFSRQAEDSTRQAFQSVESIVRAFTSVSAMLESTLGAVYSSFRAVLDVADHFSRVKATFTDILSSITLFRLVRFLYRRARAFLNLTPCDDAWDTANAENAAKFTQRRKSRSWPILLFISVVIGGPYLIWKLLSGAQNSAPKPKMKWANGEADHVVARAEYSFESENDDELSFRVGDVLHLAPKEQQSSIRDWLLASVDGEKVGMVPANYVKILGKRKGRSVEDNINNLADQGSQVQLTTD